MKRRGRIFRCAWLGAAVALACALVFEAGVSTLAAANPYDARMRELGAAVAKNAAKATSAIPLLEMWRNVGWVTPTEAATQFERLASNMKLSSVRRVQAAHYAARMKLRQGDVPAARAAFGALGYVTEWRVIGPFDNEGKTGFEAELPPEKERLAAWDPSVTYSGKERAVGWRPYHNASVEPYVDFRALFRPQKNVCAFAETFVSFESAATATVWIGAAGASKAWWNGLEVTSDASYRGIFPNRQGAVVGVRPGWNRLLVKSCIAEGAWGFYGRVGAPTSGPPGPFHVDANANHPVSEDKTAKKPVAAAADLASLEHDAAGSNASPDALEALAKFLDYTGSEDPAERRAQDLAERAAKAKPTVDRWLLAARLATERGDKMRFAQAASALAPKDVRVRLLEARLRTGGPRPYDALALLDNPGTGTARIQAGLLRANVLGDLGLHESARAELMALRAQTGDVPSILDELATVAEQAGRTDEALAARKDLLAGQYDDSDARHALIEDGLRRGETDRVIAELDKLRSTDVGSASALMYLARTYRSLGRTEDASAMYSAARELAPEDTDVLLAQARFVLEQGQPDAAREALERAQLLKPQDTEVRELLSRLVPTVRRDEKYAASLEEILKRRSTKEGYPVTRLQDLTVNTVFESGLGSEFHQVAVQIQSDDGAHAWRTFSIPYEPDRQRVDVRSARVVRRSGRVLEATRSFEQQMGEPWYRIYYDSRALIVVFPTLEVGDVVEIRYRVDDTTRTNIFNDYYGDLHFFQSEEPTVHLEYVLMAPASRTFYFEKPSLKGVEYTKDQTDHEQVHRFVASNVPAVHAEPGMPGLTEISPYLHVSTYKTWNDVGRWWWGLIRDQLKPDDRIKAAVRESTRGAKTLEEKVRRIYEWVITNTRYVGLEFGVHGYKPYRVSLIVQRGFGDCKDKASLLYVMLKEAGVDARISLVRTRRNGALANDLASLAVFDHAIAYVPELDLFLDGTAEAAGYREFPSMDQGALVLIVGPNDVRLAHAPVLPPSDNVHERTLEVDLAGDGNAQLVGKERVHGGDASQYRTQYEAEGTRAERLERTLRTSFPGLVLESNTFGNLDDHNADVQFSYHARAPSFATLDGASLRVRTTVPEEFVPDLARSTTRKYALDLEKTQAYVEHRTVKAPPGWKLGSVPAKAEAKSAFGKMTFEARADGDTAQVETTIEFGKDRIAPADYPRFRQWLEEIDRALRRPIVFSKRAP